MIMPKKQNKSMTARPAGMRLDERKMAIAGAAIGGLGALGMGSVMMGTSWGAYGSRYMMGGAYGYGGFFPLGMLFGAVWGLLFGAVIGYILAWVYNKA